MGKVIENPGSIIFQHLNPRKFKGFEEDGSDDENRQHVLRSHTNFGKIEVGVLDGVRYIKTIEEGDENKHYEFFIGDVYVLDQYNGMMVSDLSVHFYTGKGNHPDYNYMVLKGPNRILVERVGQEVEDGWVKPTHGGVYSTPLVPNGDLRGLNEQEVIQHILENIKQYSEGTFEYPNAVNANFIWEN